MSKGFFLFFLTRSNCPVTRSRHIHDVLAEEAMVLALEGLGRVPVEDGDEWLQPYHEISFFFIMSVSSLTMDIYIYTYNTKLHGWQGELVN
jgi:hypothetical protein